RSRDGERIIGALDVQSTEPRAFGGNQIRSLQIMTNLLAAAIRNASLFEEQQRNLQENQRLFIETQSNLREIQRLNRQLTKDSWKQFTQEMGESSGVSIEGNRISRDVSWARLIDQAAATRQTVTDDDTEGFAIAVPIILRGEVIGAMEIEPSEEIADVDTVEIIRSVAERLAVSLDNARLFEESQESSLFEQRINQIVSQYEGANSVDELLQITLTELSQTLGAEQGAIRLAAIETNDEDAVPINGTNGGA
ncbi:MAG: GAF domain-containing protein, partial [Chloroflexota bacterium]